MTDWVAVSVDLHDDEKIAGFAKGLGVSYEHAAMRLVQLWGRLARHDNEAGDVSKTEDWMLERWAGWEGKKGRFAAAFRKAFTDHGVVNGWWDWNGRHLRKARLERERKARERAADSPMDSPMDISADTATDSPPTIQRPYQTDKTTTAVNGKSGHSVDDTIGSLAKKFSR